MDIKIIEILEDNVSLDWQRFARCSEFTDECSINAIIKYINDDEFVDKNNKSKLRSLLKILYEHHPEDYKKYIVDSLKHMKRNDVLKDLSNLGLSNISVALKHFYIQTYEKVDELQPPLKTPASVSISKKFVDLCIVDPIEVNINTIYSDERMNYLKKQMSYKPIPYNEVFMKEKSLLLISGIAGIGKSWLLRKCLIDWANNLIWKNVGFVFFFECRRLNQYQNISNINELLDFFYKDFVNDLNINNHNVVFMIDGLDEFKYLNDLINYNSSSQYPIVNVLAEIQKYKSVVAGRVYAIDQYLNVCWMAKGHNEKLAIQIMGFNQNGINNYIELNVIDEVKDAIKVVFKQSPIVKAMASVPFYLSCMCKIIANSEQRIKFSLLTMTDLYASIFLYFIQKHISKKDLPMYEMMIINSNREYILNICKIAYQFFVENKVIFSKDEIQTFFSDCNKVEVELFGFIERIETNLGYHYQFAHMTIMEFCVSVYAYNNFSGEEIIDNDKLKSCLPMICGLINKSQKSLIKFLVNLNNSNKEKISMAHICRLLDKKLFIECFYESQSSLTDEISSFIDEQEWKIFIDVGKTSYETSCESYFVNYLIKLGKKLLELDVSKKNLSDEEKNLLIKCSTNVCNVDFSHTIEFKGWKPKYKIKALSIYISKYFITKQFFERNFLPWINVCEALHLSLHDDIDFIEDVHKWIRYSNIEEFSIEYGGKSFFNLDELNNFIAQINKMDCLTS